MWATYFSVENSLAVLWILEYDLHFVREIKQVRMCINIDTIYPYCIKYFCDGFFFYGLHLFRVNVEMPKATFTKRRFNAPLLRLMARITIGWVVFLTLIPSFLLRLFSEEIRWLGAIAWSVSIILFAGLTAYLCLGFLRDRKITLLVTLGISLLIVSQLFRMGLNVGVFDIPGITERWDAVRAIDNLINGLGISAVGLAFLYVIIEILASRQQILDDHNILAAEVARREVAENNLLERVELLRSINTSVLDAIIMMDDAGHVKYWNPAAERILGFSAEEMEGKPLHEILLPESQSHAYACNRSAWQRAGDDSLVGKTTPLKAVTKGGVKIDVELSVSSMMLGGESRIVAILRDVTQRKRAEQEYRTIIQTTMDGFLAFNNEGRILDVNDACCAKTGYTREELLNMSVQDLNAVDTPEETAARLRKIEEQGFDRFETRLRRKDGDIIDAEISVNLSAPGVYDRICAFIRNITERKRREQERRDFEAQIQYTQRLESLGVLAGGIAHDFNNILQIIMGNIDMLETDISATSPSHKYIEQLRKSVDRASSLTHQMLAYSGRRNVALDAIDMGAVVHETVQFVQASLSKKVMLQIDLAEDLPFIEADAAQIEQVVMNLVLNAAESLDEERGGMVMVSTLLLHCSRDYLKKSRALYKAPEGHYVCLQVVDTGCGMSKETMKKLFEPFYTTKFPGRGLGMAAVLGIMSSHKGAIIVQSSPGKGTTVRALFPASTSTAAPVTEATFEAPIAMPREAYTVLLVDDEPELRAVGLAMLKQLGYTGLAATDGLQAIEIFKEEHENIDCVLLDLSMPHMDGIQTHRALRRIKADVPIILMSGYAEQDIEARLSGDDVTAFLAKPYNAYALAKTLERVLA